MPRQVASTVRSSAFRSRVFELGEDLLDRVEVGRVGRQEEQLGAGGADRSADRLAFVAAEIVHDDDVAGGQGGQQALLDIGEKADAVDRPVDDAGRLDAVTAQRCQESQGAPAADAAPWPPAARRGRSARAGASYWSWPRSRR